MTRYGRLASALVFLAVLAAWVLAMASLNDFYEKVALPLGALWLLIALSLAWRTDRRAIKYVVVGALTALTVGFGVTSLRDIATRQAAKGVVAVNTMVQTQRALAAWTQLEGEPPAGDWDTVRPLLNDSGLVAPLTLTYGDGQTITYKKLPRKDEWGCLFGYTKTGPNGFELRTTGPDRRWKTADDLVRTDRSAPLPTPLPIPYSYKPTQK
jgi:hypothetical protein